MALASHLKIFLTHVPARWSWLSAETSVEIGNQNTCHLAWASSQHSCWIPRVCIPRNCSRSATVFLHLLLQVTFCLSRRSQSFLLKGEHQKICDHVLKSLVFSWVLVGYFLLTWLQSHWSFPMSCPICCQAHLMYTLFCVFPFYNFHLIFLSFQECCSSFLIYYLIFLW